MSKTSLVSTKANMKVKQNTMVLFLDVDGVLNSDSTDISLVENLIQDDRMTLYMDKSLVHKLNSIQEAVPDVQWILSSSWRIFGINEVNKFLKDKGFTGELIDMTPLEFCYTPRWEEIANWLRTNKHTGPYCILDDDTAGGGFRHMPRDLMRRWIQINPKVGLTQKNVKEAIELLQEVN